jgi:hypothetical protein
MYPQNSFRQQAPLYPQQQMQGMSLNMPLGMFQPPQQSNDGVIALHGLDSAKQYPMKPNSTVPTFDLDSDHAFILDADAKGVVSIKILKFKIVSEEEYRKATASEAPIQIAKAEYDELLNRIKRLEEESANAKQLIREQAATKSSYLPAATTNESAVTKRSSSN